MYKPITSLYSPHYPTSLVLILDESNYQENRYIKKVWKTKDFSKVLAHKTKLRKKATILLMCVRLGIIIEILGGIALIYFGLKNKIVGGVPFGIALILLYPILWSHIIALVVALRRWHTLPSNG